MAKTWNDFKLEWEHLKNTTTDAYIAKKELYVLFYFLEEIGASEPWKDECKEKIMEALKTMTEKEQEEFYDYFKMAKDMC